MTTALLVCAAPVLGSEQLVAELAAGVDIVVGVDGGAAVCLRAGVVADLVIGDLDSLDPDSLARLEAEGVAIETYPSEKDDTDLDLALRVVRSRGVDAATVTGAFAGRLDHTLAAIGALVRAEDLRPVIREPDQIAWVLSGEHRSRHPLTEIGATVSALALNGPAVVSFTGVRWPLDRAVLGPLSSLGVSNLVVADPARFTVHEGTVLLVQPRCE